MPEKETTTTPVPAKVDDNATSKGNGAGPDPKLASATTTDQPASKSRFKKFVPLVVLALAAVILFGIIGGWNRWVGSGTQKTDDAILRADITPLSTRVSGTVVQVAVADYQRVKAGDLLVQLKDDDFKAQVAQSEAGVAANSIPFCRAFSPGESTPVIALEPDFTIEPRDFSTILARPPFLLPGVVLALRSAPPRAR